MHPAVLAPFRITQLLSRSDVHNFDIDTENDPSQWFHVTLYLFTGIRVIQLGIPALFPPSGLSFARRFVQRALLHWWFVYQASSRFGFRSPHGRTGLDIAVRVILKDDSTFSTSMISST